MKVMKLTDTLPTVEEVFEKWRARERAIEKAINNPGYQYFKSEMVRRQTLKANDTRPGEG